MPNMRTFVLVGILIPQTALLGGCAAAVVTGAAAGTAAVYDRRTTGTLIDDQFIELKAIDAIGNDQELHEQAHLNVTSFNNIVLLTGETPNEALRQRTAELVRNLPKVRKVHNEIVVAAPSSLLSRSGDTWITGKVKTELLNVQKMDATRVKVVTENGVVYLMGLVTTEEAETATDVTRQVDGVQRVVKVFEYIDS
jgi:osmotically-inducible protein OsmY